MILLLSWIGVKNQQTKDKHIFTDDITYYGVYYWYNKPPTPRREFWLVDKQVNEGAMKWKESVWQKVKNKVIYRRDFGIGF